VEILELELEGLSKSGCWDGWGRSSLVYLQFEMGIFGKFAIGLWVVMIDDLVLSATGEVLGEYYLGAKFAYIFRQTTWHGEVFYWRVLKEMFNQEVFTLCEYVTTVIGRRDRKSYNFCE